SAELRERIEGATYIGLNLLDSREWVKQYRVEHRAQITDVTIAVELMEFSARTESGVVFVARPSGELLLLKCTPNGFTDFDDKPYEHQVEVLGQVCYMAECFR
ncbi:MAG: hypothetical protein JF563_06735, partial [Acidobacteriales bacterium]|nr:hypothetical protein [Terriglobales bacterium]